MKRDMDLIRAILLEAERLTPSPAYVDKGALNLPDRDPDEVELHLSLLHEAGLIDAIVDGDGTAINRLTWEGYEFLDSARDNSRWRKVRDLVATKGGTAAFEVVKQVLIQVAKSELLGHTPT